jgi:hypothetical protein
MEQFFTDFFVAISPALQSLLQAVTVAAVGMGIAWVKAAYETEKAKLSGEQQYILALVVSTAVRAAEQVKEDGADKLAYAFDIAEKALKSHGITIDIDVLYAEIEAEVFSNNANG